MTFMSVMYFFTNLMGKVGSFLMLVFMVIQLAGSVGTYPLELSGSFVKYLHDWVPFTYTVTRLPPCHLRRRERDRMPGLPGGMAGGLHAADHSGIHGACTAHQGGKAYPDGLAGTTPPGLIHNASGPLQNKPIKNKRGLEPERVSKPRRLLYS